jgi:ribosomal protein S12 methylthiotransferase accessory factor
MGFRVVKVVIPNLHPLYLDEKHPYLGGKRLYDVPVKLGFLKNPRKEDEFNKISHPFL